MKRCSFCEWIPILPWPVWPLAGQCSLGQNAVVGSMTLRLAVRGNIATRSMSGPPFALQLHRTTIWCRATGLGACRLIPLKARVFVERGVVGIRDLRVIRGLLIVGCARHGGTQIHDLLRVLIDEEDVFVGVRFLLAAVVLLLFGVIFRTLAAAFAPVHRQVGTASACQITGRHTPRVTLGGLPEGAQGLLQDRQEAMNPV